MLNNGKKDLFKHIIRIMDDTSNVPKRILIFRLPQHDIKKIEFCELVEIQMKTLVVGS